jgi:hypothetical protein
VIISSHTPVEFSVEINGFPILFIALGIVSVAAGGWSHKTTSKSSIFNSASFFFTNRRQYGQILPRISRMCSVNEIRLLEYTISYNFSEQMIFKKYR